MRIFTQNASDAEIANLRALYDELYVVRRSRDTAAIAKAATAFSGYMLKVADHELIGDLHRKLTARMSALRGISISHPGRLEQAAEELATIMAAIERRDGESAARYFAVHVRNAGEAAWPTSMPSHCRHSSPCPRSLRNCRALSEGVRNGEDSSRGRPP